MMMLSNWPRKQGRSRYALAVLAAVVAALLFMTTSILPSAQGDDPAGVCAATVEQLDGQGRFEMGGLGRFEMGGLEGDDATLDESDGISAELLDEIMDNPITLEWLVNLLPYIEDSKGLGDNPVAILIVDDFRDATRVFQAGEFPEEWIQQYENFYHFPPSFPLEVPVFTHGMRVESQLKDLLEAMDDAEYTHSISLHRVDISTGGDYDLDSVASGIAAKINQLKDLDIDRFVINMSFGLIPCADPGSGANFDDYLDHVGGLLLDGDPSHFVIDIDASVTINNETMLRPVIRLDYGFKQHLYENVFGGDLNSVHEYMNELLHSPNVGEDSDEPEIVALRALLQDLLSQSADREAHIKVIPIAASGNFADIIVPDAPLAPAKYPEVIAVGATLGEKSESERWFFSQAAHMLTPGAWWEFDLQNSFVAGTSFAAPYASVMGAIYLTYEDACYFDGSRPPLFDFEHSNRKVTEEDLQFACDPAGLPVPPDPTATFTLTATATATATSTATSTATATATSTATSTDVATFTATSTATATHTLVPTPDQMLRNTGFETGVQGKPAQANNWIGKQITGDRRLCNNEQQGIIHAYNGQCAFRFAGGKGENSQILQNYKGQLPVTGNTLTLSAYLRGQNVKPGGYLRVLVKYVGSPVQQKIQIDVPTGTYAYTLYTTEPLLIGEGSVKYVKMLIGYKGKGGKFWADDVLLIRDPGGF